MDNITITMGNNINFCEILGVTICSQCERQGHLLKTYVLLEQSLWISGEIRLLKANRINKEPNEPPMDSMSNSEDISHQNIIP